MCLGVAGLGLSLTSVGAGAMPLKQNEPENVQLTNAAWDAYNRSDFEQAIKAADKCIDEFQGDADRKQASLEGEHPTIPVGKVSKDEKKKILANGVLNDVATCFFIKGRSAENLKRMDDAKQAYKAAAKYIYARTWDPKGWFWSPADAASDRLKRLE